MIFQTTFVSLGGRKIRVPLYFLFLILTCSVHAARFSLNAKRRKHDSKIKNQTGGWENAGKGDLTHFCAVRFYYFRVAKVREKLDFIQGQGKSQGVLYQVREIKILNPVQSQWKVREVYLEVAANYFIRCFCIDRAILF